MLTAMLRTIHTKTLREYLDGLPRGGVTGFSGRVAIAPVYLLQLAARQNGREASPELCVRIEQATDGVVSRSKLRPNDWHRLWPELITATHPAPALEARDAA